MSLSSMVTLSDIFLRTILCQFNMYRNSIYVHITMTLPWCELLFRSIQIPFSAKKILSGKCLVSDVSPCSFELHTELQNSQPSSPFVSYYCVYIWFTEWWIQHPNITMLYVAGQSRGHLDHSQHMHGTNVSS